VYVVIATKPVQRLQIRQPNGAQLEGTPYQFPKLHPGPCSNVGMQQGTDRQAHRQTAVANIHFASGMPHLKCNNAWNVWRL